MKLFDVQKPILHKTVIYIPNLLSILRIILAFVFGWTLFQGNIASSIIILSIAGITDFLDGYIARKFNIVSQFGATIDPLADKILMFITYVIFAYMNLIPPYVAFIVIGRDIMILSSVILCFTCKIKLKMAPIMSSKINTTVQIIYLVFVLTCNCFHIHITSISEYFAWFVVITTVWSGAEYVQKYWWIGREIFR